MKVDKNPVTIYCMTFMQVGFGMSQGDLVDHGAGRSSAMHSGPFVEFLPKGARKSRRIVTGAKDGYLLIMRGTDYPDPPAPFRSRPGSALANGFSPPESSNATFDRVFAFDERALDVGDIDGRYRAAFDSFVDQYSERFVADYRSNPMRRNSLGTETPPRVVDGPVHAVAGAFDDNEVHPQNDPTLPFDATSLDDERRRVLANSVTRPGQAVFRANLMRAYEGRCAITGCNIPAALEAAHIVPFCGPASDNVANGLLLRLDIHSLFDAFLLSIDPEEMKVHLRDNLEGGYYEVINGRKIRLPTDASFRPDYEALAEHFRKFSAWVGPC